MSANEAPALGKGRLRRAGSFGWHHRRRIGTLLVVAGIFGAGAALGWSLRDRSGASVEETTVSVERPVTALEAVAASRAIPNVLGLPPDQARRVLFDSGVAMDSVTVVDVPAAGDAGLVVTQDPSPGIPVTGTVTLGVGKPTTVPNVAGSPLETARRALDQLGARMLLRSVYAEGATEGTVVSSDPAAGAPLGTDVLVVVASAPSSVFLSGLQALSGACTAADAVVNGSPMPSSLYCSPTSTPGESRETVYLVNRKASRFEATVGQDDKSKPGAVLRVVIKADGRVVAEERFGYGETKAVAIDIAGVLRLSIETSLVVRPENSSAPAAVLGSARLVGGPDAIDELTATS